MVRLLIIAMLVFMMSCEKSTSSSETWLVVNGVLVEGEFPQVMLKRPVGLESNASGEPVAGAKVMIYGPDAIITLTEIEGGNGLYSDVNGVMPIEAGAIYRLVVKKGDEEAFSATQVPQAVALVQSSATSIPINPASTGQPIYSIFWTQVEGFTHVLKLDIEEEMPEIIPFSVSSGNFNQQYSFPVPGQGTTIFDTDFYYYGAHKLTVFSIADEYDAIFFYQNGAGGEQITEGPDNIEGGSGYFTSASKLEVELDIFEE